MSKPQLLGSYSTPTFRYGATVTCAIRGDVQIVALSDGRIPWPLGKTRGSRHKSFVIYRGLEKAILRESNTAVQHWWGVTAQTVSKWRKVLGVSQHNEGTLCSHIAAGRRSAARGGLVQALKKSRDAQRRAKIAAAKRGKPRPRHVIEAMREARLGMKHSARTRQQMSATHRRRL